MLKEKIFNKFSISLGMFGCIMIIVGCFIPLITIGGTPKVLVNEIGLFLPILALVAGIACFFSETIIPTGTTLLALLFLARYIRGMNDALAKYLEYSYGFYILSVGIICLAAYSFFGVIHKLRYLKKNKKSKKEIVENTPPMPNRINNMNNGVINGIPDFNPTIEEENNIEPNNYRHNIVSNLEKAMKKDTNIEDSSNSSVEDSSNNNVNDNLDSTNLNSVDNSSILNESNISSESNNNEIDSIENDPFLTPTEMTPGSDNKKEPITLNIEDSNINTNEPIQTNQPKDIPTTTNNSILEPVKPIVEPDVKVESLTDQSVVNNTKQEEQPVDSNKFITIPKVESEQSNNTQVPNSVETSNITSLNDASTQSINNLNNNSSTTGAGDAFNSFFNKPLVDNQNNNINSNNGTNNSL